jgi:hypothetical protein
LRRREVVGFATLFVGCAAATNQAPSAGPPPAASPPAVLPDAPATPRASPPQPPPVSKESLAARLREPEWDAASEVDVFELNDARVVVADFETTAKRSDGMPVGFRRFGLFSAEPRLLGQVTVKMSEGGADLLEHELRDVDGDQNQDYVLYYSAEDQWNPRVAGWVAATARGQLIHGPLTLQAPADRRFVGSGCWTTIDGAPVLIVLWQDTGPDRSGQPAVRGYRATASTIDAQGLKPVSVFGLTAEEGPDGEALDRRVPAAQRPAELESPLRMTDCSQAPPTVLVTPARRGWAMISGLSLDALRAGAAWPKGLLKTATSHLFEIPPVDPTLWQTNPDPK